ncbi:MAG: squalene/phytoene synthase family protein [Candidatus Micrarchaeota archaeon]|nr:squalene/phytoene synthase family protein [Candidatus Micrarchaeota archaeon]
MLWQILPKVSRSFALCIKILPKPLNSQMMLAYLIFRIFDTIEDSHASISVKRELFAETLSLFSNRKASPAKVKQRLLSELDYTYEKELLENLEEVVKTYYSQPAGVRRAILKRGRTMAHGMLKFQGKNIETFADQNRYSYYVAGVIGYLFNDLLYQNKIITKALKHRLHRYAHQFGLALQKVNILRDIAKDISENRRYWPAMLIRKYGLSYENLCLKENREKAIRILEAQIENARRYLEAAMKYIMLLPRKAVRVRMFCLIPLFMAIESYVKCAQSPEVFDSGTKVKITRLQVQEIVAKSGLWGSSNDRLLEWFDESMARQC